ncbi:helix-turn-helix domain-containing protein [Pseudomonas sp. MSSRFD41]|uniref:RodZ domain-containing protein n=1 Tax=unclassified Pseudomonas TaxID=196821 RepID=UPI00163AB01C|nr:RodZ family helix-turn-helix domain-containing protein [Pseudomonas sp. MSSRFD41]MBC2656041.1 helix-turn-helix domain-containing protein [Pseudomonas sp. MSSRFD41]
MKVAQPEVQAATSVNPGETLRQARESNGWALADVAHKLNLTVSSLSNLEAGAFDKLPGHTFARGYIRAYAKLLDMDQATLVQAFDQYTGTDSQGSSVHALGRIEEPVRVSHTILRIVSLLLLVAVVGGGFIWWQDQTSQRSKELVGLSPEHVEVEGADGKTQIHPIDEPEDQAVAEGQSEAEANAAQLAGEAPVQTPAPVVAPAAPVQAPAVAPATATHPVTAPATAPVIAAPVVVAPVPATTVTAQANVPAPTVAAAGSAQVQIQFSADCWTQVTDGNGKILLSALKRKGESVDVSGKPPFAVRLGYARGAQISYNGQAVDIAPFTTGETARLKLGQ